MSVVFFAQNKQNSASLTLPGTVACHMLVALAYDIDEVAESARLTPEEMLPRIDGVRRQVALGAGCEFTNHEVDEPQLLRYLDELEKLAVRAREGRRPIVLL